MPASLAAVKPPLYPERMAKRDSLTRSAGDTPFVRWLVSYCLDRGFASGRQAAKMLRDADGAEFNQSVFASWLRGDQEPGPESQERLAQATGAPIGAIADLVRRSKAERREREAAERLAHRPAPRPEPTVSLELPRELAEAAFRLWVGAKNGGPVHAHAHAGVPVAPAPSSRLRPYEVEDGSLEPRVWPGWLAWTETHAAPRVGTVSEPGDIVRVRVGERVYHAEAIADPVTGRPVLRTRDGRPPVPLEDAEVLGVVTWVQHPP